MGSPGLENMTMISRGYSFFVAGVLVGVLMTTAAFAILTGRSRAWRDSPGQITVLKLGHELDGSHPVHLAMLKMAELLREKSNGTVALEIFPNGQLGSETQCIEQLQHGALDLTKSSTAPLENFIPELSVLGIPYVFRDEVHFWRVLEGDVGKSLLVAGCDIGLRGLCFYDAGARSFYTSTTPILVPEDLHGLKIRVQESKTAMDMVTALGGSPTPIAYGELYTALQQRMVDGAENNPPSFFTNRHYEVCKHYSLDEHTRVPDILLIGESAWQQLPPQIQTWLQEAAHESSVYQRQLWRTRTKDCLQAVESKGVTIHHPDQRAFSDKVARLLARYEVSAWGGLLRRIREVPSD
jgi:tripartite ATP-independent transporter DctP family solute receptor